MNKITDKDINTIDCVNLGVGSLIILSALFAFWDGEVKPFMFPVIFLLAAYMNCMWGIKRAGKNNVAAVGFLGIGIALCLIAVGLMI
jgi:hypothetical protein